MLTLHSIIFPNTIFKLKKSGINQGFIERFKKVVAAQVVINSLAGSVNATNPKNLTVEDQVNNVLETIKEKPFSESVGIINTTALPDQARQQLYRSLVIVIATRTEMVMMNFIRHCLLCTQRTGHPLYLVSNRSSLPLMFGTINFSKFLL